MITPLLHEESVRVRSLISSHQQSRMPLAWATISPERPLSQVNRALVEAVSWEVLAISSIQLLVEVKKVRRTRIILTKVSTRCNCFYSCFRILHAKFLPGVDMIQQYGMGQGDQSNESAVEQAKDEQISDFIRGQYKSQTGSDFPIKDKER